MSHVTPTIPHPQHLTPHTSFGARSGFQALLDVAEQELDMIRKGEAVMEEELMEEKLKSRLFVPHLLSHIPFKTRSLNPYPAGAFKTVIQKEYARASQKEIREDLSALSSVSTVCTAMSLRQRTADAVSANLPLHNSTSDALCLECGLPGDVLQVVTREHCIAQEVETFLSERSCFYARVAGLLDRRLRCAHAPAVLRCKPQPCVAVSPMRHTKTNSAIGSALHRLHCEGLRGRHRHVWNLVRVSALVRVDCGVVNDNVYSIAQFILNRLTIRL